MSLLTRFALILLTACLVISVAPKTADAEDIAAFPPGPGREVFIRTCTRCHEASNSTKLRLTRRQWQGKVYQQADRGAEVSGDELDQIIDYLFKNFPAESVSK